MEMDQEKTLLQQIRDKERELSGELDAAIKASEAIVIEANRHAGDIIARVEAEGKRVAEEFLKAERERIAREVEEVRKRGDVLAAKAEEEGRKKIPAAARMVVSVVAPEEKR